MDKTGAEIVLNWMNKFKEQNGSLPKPDEIESQLEMAIYQEKTAIEVNNVKGLIEALEKMNDYFIHERDLTDIELSDLKDFAIEQLEKAKTNG